MTRLILSPLKVILRNTPEEWLEATGGDTILLTGFDQDHSPEWLDENYGKSFQKIIAFRSYAANDLVLKTADELFAEHTIEAVVPMAEIDVLRAALLRERHNLPGLLPQDAVYLRDKILMKEKASAAGVPVAKWKRVTNALEVVDFAAEAGYPIVLKPIDGRGSAHTFVIDSPAELDEHLENGVLSATDRLPDLIVEEFIHGKQYRIDGFYARGKCQFISAGRFIGTHLEFLAGGHLINALLDAKSELAKELVAFTRNILENVLPLGEDGMFHVEVFRRPNGELVLGEAAARLAGASVFEENLASFGVNFKMAAVRSYCGFEPPSWPPGEQLQQRLAGHVLISPKPGVLVKAPEALPFDWVYSFRCGPVGKRYEAMAYTNAEVATILVTGKDDREIEDRLIEAIAWFHDNTEWEQD
ncbi:Biotin carboxylase [Amycolatopsis xylanica]|uniref:Biotin carboxylase n=1 Tax=Amycolatopsis xylanica TaxID=589385 RepID=A0A1H3EXW9_9PSEU|nr:ATP-grasp domain-containing protein [Amycolatopsis xylanica]SDX82928.1 Biotin carboxylase [Amycolatopsis xylanica]